MYDQEQVWMEKVAPFVGDFIAERTGLNVDPATGKPLGYGEKFHCGIVRFKKRKFSILPSKVENGRVTDTECFVSTEIATSTVVLSLVATMLCRIATDSIKRENRIFRVAAANVGLIGESEDRLPALGSDLETLFDELVAMFGEYPHIPTSNPKTTPTTGFKIWCANEHCSARKGNRGVTARVSRTWLSQKWACPTCGEFMAKESEDDS